MQKPLIRGFQNEIIYLSFYFSYKILKNWVQNPEFLRLQNCFPSSYFSISVEPQELIDPILCSKKPSEGFL